MATAQDPIGDIQLRPTLNPKQTAGQIVTATLLRFVLSNNLKLTICNRPPPLNDESMLASTRMHFYETGMIVTE